MYVDVTTANFAAEITGYGGTAILLFNNELPPINSADAAQESALGLVALYYQANAVANIKFCRCDAPVERVLANAERIRELPTTVIYKNGIEQDREKGMIGPDNLKAWIEKFR